VGGDAVDADAGFATERLQLVPLTTRFGDRYDERECRSAEAHWREHGFGHWALLDRQTGAFIGSAEVHYAYRGVEGISVDEIEVGIEILPEYRGQGYATEAVTAAVVDTRRRTGADHLVAYTRPDHSVAIGLMEKIGFEFRSIGIGREGEPAAIYTLSRQKLPRG
jgi:RimJ/RimL family protein N-acetyltransferase